MKVEAIIAAAGIGQRMGGSTPKPFLEIQGKPLFVRTIEAMADCSLIEKIIFSLNTIENYG